MIKEIVFCCLTIPFGSGNLYENILELNKRQHLGNNDPRFFGDLKILKGCQFIAAACKFKDKNTKMDKLFTCWNTSKDFKFVDYRKYCSPKSRIIEVEDEFIDEAIDFAKTNNIIGEPSCLSSLALFFQLEHKLDHNKKILLVNTGCLKI